jgi:flagellar hook assembly protein FlgD
VTEDLESGKFYAIWDGRDKNGKLAPEGYYMFVIKIMETKKEYFKCTALIKNKNRSTSRSN